MRGFDGDIPQVGERVICCRNNSKEGLFNGGMGTLKKIATRHEKMAGTFLMDVEMEDLDDASVGLLVDPYLFGKNFTNGQAEKLALPRGMPRLDEFDFSYALTCHKAQGSQFPDVTVIDDSGSFRDNAARWLYTAATRAESGLTILSRQ